MSGYPAKPMSELSGISQTLYDYARSAAKRNWSAEIGPEHLFVAIRRLDTRRFDNEFPHVAAKLELLLSRKQGQALAPTSVDEIVMTYLKNISDRSHLAVVASGLHKSLEKELEESGSPQYQSPTHEANVQVPPKSDSNTREANERQVNASNQIGGLALNLALATRIAEHLQADLATVVSDLASDGLLIAQEILGRDSPLVRSALLESLAVGGIVGSEFISDLQIRLLANGGVEPDRLATRLGLAFVDMAEFAASLDDVVTDAEITSIDHLRLRMRRYLGDRIDATSDAFIEFEQQFSELVGMESVKNDLRKRVGYILVNKRRASRGQAAPVHRMHMAFVGNPGTGKTTVARLYGQLLYKLGLIGSDVFVETDRAGLIGMHLGETEMKTIALIQEASGGILFVDEAYALNDRYSGHKGFGEEALDVLVKEMEDRRDSLAVILAGYSDRMNELLSINPGLKSRIPSVITFPDYSSDELLEIGRRIAKTRGLRLDLGAEAVMKALLEAKKKEDGFGNAREVENLVDAAQRNQLERLVHLGNLATTEENSLIASGDIPTLDD